nr:Gfo/Idh/MocA family oxidoreductase [Flavihumibacter sp. CACIAM 22H1]
MELAAPNYRIAANDLIRIGVIGMGIMGHRNLRTALKVPGISLAGVCDLYQGRLTRARELYGNTLFITNDYKVLIDRPDIDAVIIATSDHWHAPIATYALKKGKAVYGEKPVVHQISEGLPLIAAQQQSGKIMQVGSQRVSSLLYAKAKELYQSGAIGKLNLVEATYDRQSALGAWQYTQPSDASLATIDWDGFLRTDKKAAFDAKKFFWWRNYRAFGTGVAGDLFVHLLSGVHLITGSVGPVKIYSSGQLAYWKDGRDVPDIMTAIMDYPASSEHPAFQLTLRVNFISGGGDTSSIRFVGEEGVLTLNGRDLELTHSLLPKAPGIGGWDALETYPAVMQEQLLKSYEQQFSATDRRRPVKAPYRFVNPEGYDDHLDHFINFFEAIRTGKPVVEDVVFGFRAAAPCLACNESYFQQKTIYWDPLTMKLINRK